jgi:hypothetical protein
MGVLSNSPLGKYITNIQNSPRGIFNQQLILTVIMYALAGMPKGIFDATRNLSFVPNAISRLG